MSKKTSQWLQSHHSHFNSETFTPRFKRATKISVASGKGGVGKTTCALKFAKVLADSGNKVLVVDCDYNLANTAVKLGLPINNHFHDLVSSKISFDEALYKEDNFHLLSACNGHTDLFNQNLEMSGMIIDIVSEYESRYDYIILDCPAGLNRDVCDLSSFCDYRFIVVTPDKSSITDSYSLIKILGQNYGIDKAHLIFNKISNRNQYLRLAKTFLDTADRYLDVSLSIAGKLPFLREKGDCFDLEIVKIADSKIHDHFFKIINNFTEKNINANPSLMNSIQMHEGAFGGEQEVRTY